MIHETGTKSNETKGTIVYRVEWREVPQISIPPKKWRAARAEAQESVGRIVACLRRRLKKKRDWENGWS